MGADNDATCPPSQPDLHRLGERDLPHRTGHLAPIDHRSSTGANVR